MLSLLAQQTTTILSAAMGCVCLALIVGTVIARLRRLRLTRIERRYMHRWARLSLAEKAKVLQIMGVVPLTSRRGRESSKTEDASRLDRLFRAVLAESGRDLGLSGIGGLVSSALPLALLDAEVEWALSEGTKPRASRRSAT